MPIMNKGSKSKDSKVDDYTVHANTQLHMSTVYTRQKSPNRNFNFVICGLLMSSFLLGSIALSGGNVAYAATSNPTTQAVTAVEQMDVNYQDERALIANLSHAVKAIKESGLSAKVLLNLMNGLDDIYSKASSPEGFVNVKDLKPVLLETEQMVTSYGSNAQTVKDKLSNIRQKVGLEASSNSAVSSPVSKKNEVKILSAANLDPSVVINGVKQSYPQSPVIQNGSTLVPLRGIFESLGATVSWNGETETVTATKGSTEITLKVGSDTSYVNGKQVQLAAPSMILNGSTMVPLRFVSEAFGGTVKWDNDTRTAYIETASSTTSPTGQMVGNIKVSYGKHTYKSSNEKEYNAVMEIVNNAVKGVDDVVFGGELYSEFYGKYLDGARWSGSTKDRSVQNRGLKFAENTIGPLVEEGLSKDEIIKAYKTVNVALQLIQGKENPGDGSPSSAADTLLYNRSDCDSDAQVYSAVFDAMQYNTAIIGGSNHAQILIKIGGSWFTTAAGSFEKVDVQKALKNDSVIVSDPTFGRSTL